MKKNALRVLVLIFCLSILCYPASGFESPFVNCTPYTRQGPDGIQPFSLGSGDPTSYSSPEHVTLYKTERRVVAWPDFYQEAVIASSQGDAELWYQRCHIAFEEGFCSPSTWADSSSYCWRKYYECWPQFYDPEYFSDGHYRQRLYRQSVYIYQPGCGINERRDDPSCVQGPDVDTVNKQHTCSTHNHYSCQNVDASNGFPADYTI